MEQLRNLLDIPENKDRLEALRNTVRDQLFSWGTLSAEQKVKRLVRKVVLRQLVAPDDGYFWPHAMLAEGLVQAAKCDAEDAFCREQKASDTDVLKKYYDKWMESGQKIFYVDNAAHGMPLLDLYEKTGEQKYLDAAKKLADYLAAYPLDSQGNLVYRLKNAGHVYADSLGMICPFLCRYGKLTGAPDLVDLGVMQLTNFLKYGMDPVSGLPYHGYDSRTGVKYGCIGWGRAAGWLMMGLSGSLMYLPEDHEQYPMLYSAMKQLTDVVFRYQREDGGFSWLLPAVEGPADTSAAAMIGCSVVQLVQREKNADEMLSLVRFLLMHTENGKVDCASGECEGFSQYPQRYGSYPWANGPALKMFEMLRKFK